MNAQDIKYTDMEWIEGNVNLPGIKRNVYYIPKREIVGWPTRKGSFTSKMGELATLQGSFVLAAGCFWRLITCIVEKSPLDGKSQGTKPSKTFINSLTVQHEGVEEDATAFAMMANNDDFVYLVETKPGKWRVIGNDMYATETSPEQNLGGAATDEMYTKLAITVTDLAPALFYVGQIVTESGIINEDAEKVESVTIAPNGGNIDAGTDTVALTTPTLGATIEYKIGTGNWQKYQAPIVTTNWAGEVVLTARARLLDYTDSDQTTATFTAQ